MFGIVISMTTQMFWWATPAKAQSLLQQLFGASSPPPQAQPMPRMVSPRGPVSGLPPRLDLTQPHIGRPQHQQQPQRSQPAPQEGTGSFTTVCVRLCDGFYFPVSHRATRGRFQHDAEQCRSRCGHAEARLFYYPSAGGSMNEAIDLNGRAYSRLKTAFLHRKQLVAGCACKPEPWSAASMMRHQTYALNEGLNLDGSRRGIGTVTVVAGQYPDPGAQPASESAGEEAAAAETASDAPAATDVAVVPTSEAQQAGPAQAPSVSASSADQTQRAPARAKQPPRSEVSLRPALQRPGATAKAAARTTALPPRQPARLASAAPASSGSFLGLGGGGTMRWPGDQQR